MRVSSMILLTTVLGGCTLLHGQTRDDYWKQCAGTEPDPKIAACTALIQSGQETPDNTSKAFNNRGNGHSAKGEFALAIQDFDQALKLNPNYALAFNNRGNAHSDRGEYDLAIPDYNESILLNPDNASALNNRANAYLRMGKYETSIPDFDQSLQLKPTFLNARRGRAAANFYLGRFALAQEDFAEAIKSTPGDAYSILWLYVAQSRAGQDGRAALEQNSAHMPPLTWPAQLVDFYLGKTTSDAVMSAADDPNSFKNQSQLCEAYFFLAEHALSQGNKADAKHLFQRAIDTGATWELQYAGAREELKRVQASTAKTGR
jgi:lipoprotein NlpI